MFLDAFHNDNNGQITVSDEQASRFAKDVADDFNPIHDTDAQRFCVPGDLLFSLVLSKYGLSQKMSFRFASLVGHGVTLLFPEEIGEEHELQGAAGKTYLHVNRSGNNNCDQQLVESFSRQYVSFSGHNFPHILVPLMAEHNVMINPDRPLVIYESMAFDLTRVDFQKAEMEIGETTLEVVGKRGNARLYFNVLADGESVGTGYKKLVMSGLREYDENIMKMMTDIYAERKATMGSK